jgi:hypothetical protein
VNSVLDANSNKTITKKICLKGSKLCWAKGKGPVIKYRGGGLEKKGGGGTIFMLAKGGPEKIVHYIRGGLCVNMFQFTLLIPLDERNSLLLDRVK